MDFQYFFGFQVSGLQVIFSLLTCTTWVFLFMLIIS